MKKKELFYRFEIYLDGEPTGGGIFQGVKGIVDGSTQANMLNRMNRDLPLPPMGDITNNYELESISYFSKYGMEYFAKDIELVRYLVRHSAPNCELRRVIVAMSPDDERIKYADSYQIVLLRDTEQIAVAQ